MTLTLVRTFLRFVPRANDLLGKITVLSLLTTIQLHIFYSFEACMIFPWNYFQRFWYFPIITSFYKNDIISIFLTKIHSQNRKKADPLTINTLVFKILLLENTFFLAINHEEMWGYTFRKTSLTTQRTDLFLESIYVSILIFLKWMDHRKYCLLYDGMACLNPIKISL